MENGGNNMITLAIDASTKSSGWSIYDGQDLKDYGCITASSSNLFRRIHKMVDEIEKIIKQYNVEEVAIEDVIPDDVRHNQNVYKALVYLQGFLADKFDEYGLKVTYYVASAWRKKCAIHTGRGIKRESLKPKDMEFVKNQFGLSVNDDVADAICIGFAHVGGIVKKPQVEITDDGFEFR
jgi:Holliday junction resolvasome RuvABC endonuclease subunit